MKSIIAPAALLLALLVALSACGSSTTETTTDTEAATEAETTTETEETTESESDTEAASETDTASETDSETTVDAGESSTFTAEVWADNWFALYVNGELVGEDSVPITTERSFNSETFTFDATYPLTIAIEAKDFKETDSGIEYIGESNQQMGDGGLIAQITDNATGAAIVTDDSWTALTIHQAPLDKSCESDPDPDATCEFEASDAPADWTTADFDDSSWDVASVWSESDVDPKIGYDEISWYDSAQLIWGSDLEIDNTVLFRVTAGS